MAISEWIQALQDVAWPEFLLPHVEVLLLWITWAVDYIDLDYLEYLLWLLLPFFILFIFPIFLVLFIYGCVIFVHIYGHRHQIREAYHTRSAQKLRN
uniref:Uncharacterized protein n=2 Tax=Caenorhabditis japonica TaxID=281687 RepID=A0A8R1DIE3_CAEJA